MISPANAFRNPLLILLIVLSAWWYVFQSGFLTAVAIWNISEIFTHCFLVLPCSLYFIYQKRQALAETPFTPNYWVLPILAGCLFVQLFGVVGDIQLFMHIATFTSLPILIWCLIGNQAAKVILFPLAMILFAIPVGEQLIPFLQELTTDIAVPLLELTNVPIYRNGLYLDIPEGRFLVAEACSGISFLIASIVFGCIYAYVSFSQFYKQVIFALVAILVPILANALRVYGIVLTGHLSDMEYAVGADHLIYGGVFYGFIIFILVLIGERYRDLPLAVKEDNNDVKKTCEHSFSLTLVVMLLIMFIGQQLWLRSIVISATNTSDTSEIPVSFIFNAQSPTLLPYTSTSSWLPEFKGASKTESGVLMLSNKKVELFIAAYYANSSGELISSLNRLYSSECWTLLKHNTQYFTSLNKNIVLTQVISPQGQVRMIAHWYEISDRSFTSKIKAKLYETSLKIFGVSSVNKLVAFSFVISERDDTDANNQLLNDSFIHYQELNASADINDEHE